MCGIVGYVGKKRALNVLIDGLKNLEYRGYDSAGVAYLHNNKIEIEKEKGKIKSLEEKLNFAIESDLGIGHTRWATHGVASSINSHPHRSGKITLVHNGIIENYLELKKMLKEKGYTFVSETDSEVAAAVIDYLYKKNNNMLESLKESKKILSGAYALAIICDDDLENIYVLKDKSPLIIATNNNENYIASDVPAILKNTNKYILLDNKDYGKISNTKIEIYNDLDQKKENEILTFEGSLEVAEKNGYDHFMEKEMFEQPTVIRNTINTYIKNGIKEFTEIMPDFSKYEKIDIVACGSAMHASMIGKYLIEEFADIPVNVEIASEYRYKKLFLNEKTLVILVSQSGETADTLAALNIAKEYGSDTLAIVNVLGSSIAREASRTLYIKAGPEISVATTKAYLAQTALLALIALDIAICKSNISEKEVEQIMNQINAIPDMILDLLNNRELYKSLALEGSLKLKEISYMHSEAYAAGELKHGTISLIEEHTPVIGVVTDTDIYEKTLSNLKEVKSRGAKIITIIKEDLVSKLEDNNNIVIVPSVHKLLQPLLSIIPMQMIAYETAKLRKCDIDKPKNLAKSVTVE